MPTYNCASFISPAIISILIQTFKDFELIIINDGSADETKTIINKFNDSRIKYFEKEHSGLGDSLDYGIEKASNNLIARMDADDIAHPERLQRQLCFLNLHKEIDVLSNWYAVFRNHRIKYIIKRSVEHNQILKNLSLYSDICHPSVIFNKKLLKAMGGFKVAANYDPFGDYVVWLCNKSKLKFHNLPEVLHYYRERSNSLSNNALTNRRNIIYEIQKPYFKNSLKDEFQLTDAQELAARGWREYLYGDVKKSFFYWRKLNFRIIQHPSIIAAAALRILPDSLFQKLLGKRLPYKLHFMINYFSKYEQNVLIEFRKTINSIECIQ
jgi:glycosyltransferase involved in cell wall biosynthesis